MKPTGQAVINEMFSLVGTAYNIYDCQAAIEEAVKRAGGAMNYRGSNDMARNVAWLGTLENAKATFGNPLPVGMALFINKEVSSTTPAQYRGDGFGDFTHVGLYAGENLDAFVNPGKLISRKYNVLHSSASVGYVCGSTLKNGWTHAGFFKEIDCGVEIESGVTVSPAAEDILNQGTNSDTPVLNNEGELVTPTQNTYGIVVSADGNPVKVREAAKKDAIYKYKADVGTRVQIMGEKNGFYKIIFKGKPRWIMKEFVELEE